MTFKRVQTAFAFVDPSGTEAVDVGFLQFTPEMNMKTSTYVGP
jgi:hypothetical protein